MVVVKGFRGVRFNPEKVDINLVTSPPYDVIDRNLRDELEKSEYNIVHIDLPKGEGDEKYIRAFELLKSWLQQGILIQDEKPCYYYYTIEYEFLGEKKKLKGFIGLLKLEEFGKNVFPHEMTLSKPKEDRLKLMRHTNANISPIYTIYNDEEEIAERIFQKAEKELLYSFTEKFSGKELKHQLWRLSSPEDVEAISKLMADKRIFIADGHHRYETALAYSKERGNGDKPWNYVLTFFANMHSPGITVLSAHRVVRKTLPADFLDRAKEYFTVEEIEDREEFIRRIYSESGAIGVYHLGKMHILSLKEPDIMKEIVKNKPDVWRNLNVVVLHRLVFNRILGIDDKAAENLITYEISHEKVFSEVESSAEKSAFFLKPLSLEEIRDVAFAGEKMPGKATYFYPKLLTGLVLYKF